MAFQDGSYAKVWEVKRNTNYTDVRLSTSKKRKDTGEYETDFSGFVRFIGKAHQDAANLNDGDRIKLGSVSATRTYNKMENKNYTNFQCYSYSVEGVNQTQNTAAAQPQRQPEVPNIPEGVDEELPFN